MTSPTDKLIEAAKAVTEHHADFENMTDEAAASMRSLRAALAAHSAQPTYAELVEFIGRVATDGDKFSAEANELLAKVQS